MNIFQSFKALGRENLQNLLILFLTGLLFWIGLSTLLPTLPAYVEDVGGTTQQVGLVMGGFAIGLLLSRTWLGHLADSRSRKAVLLIGTAVGATAPLGYLFVHSIPALIAIRAFHGISVAAFTTGYSALVVDLSPLEQRGEIIGYTSLAIPIGMAIGPALGGFIQESAGYATLFRVSALLGLLALILVSLLREARKGDLSSPRSLTADKHQRSFGELLVNPALNVPAVILLLVGLVFGTLASFLPLYIRAIALNLNAGNFYTAAAIASFIARIFCGKASDRYGRGPFITGSLICYSVSMLLLAQTDSPNLFLIAAVLEGSGSGVLIPMVVALISDRCFAEERGRVFAVCVSGFDVGIAIAGPTFGILEELVGYRVMFALAAGLAALALLIFLSQSNKDFPSSFRFALGRQEDLYALPERAIL